MTFEQKKEAAKVLARSIMNTMVEQNVPLEESIEVCAITMAAICGSAPEPLTPKEAIGIFLSTFAASLQALDDKE